MLFKNTIRSFSVNMQHLHNGRRADVRNEVSISYPQTLYDDSMMTSADRNIIIQW